MSDTASSTPKEIACACGHAEGEHERTALGGPGACELCDCARFRGVAVDNQITEHAEHALARARGELVMLDRRADEATEAVVPKNTRRAYEFELACFTSWCNRHGVVSMPAEPRILRAYLFELAEKGRAQEDLPTRRGPKGPLEYSSLMRALAAICRSHHKSGHTSPWKHVVIEETRDTLARLKGTAPKHQKRDLGVTGEALLFQVCDLITNDLRGLRDRAMILVGWQGGGRRRSEIAAARVEDFRSVEGGIEWTIPRSKTDQTGKTFRVGLTPAADERYCPVTALRKWLTASKIDKGPVFRGVEMTTGVLQEGALSPDGVARRIQHYVKLLGLDPSEFGGHSLRSGFVTSASKMGRSVPDIMNSTGHRNTKEVFTYVRRAGVVEESAGRGLVDEALARRGEKKGES